ncbi:MAG TPA: hypothetical protein VND65_03265 [Candidatus Binatia bacterium]|nr:hypothetical protein [Candidatus Binatia bacterium]
MSTWTKEDLPFLVAAMDRRAAGNIHLLRNEAPAPAPLKADKVGGDMSIPQPVTVDVQGTMSVEDYKACSMLMAVCQNMVQKSLTDAASRAGIEPADALKNMNAWVKAYLDFPFPFFNFKDTQSDVCVKSNFSVNADPEVVENIVTIKGVAGLKDAVVGALKKAGGNLASYAGTDRKFNYFGIVTAYNQTDIAVRVVKFQMNLKTTDVSSLCVKFTQTNLDTVYDTYQFVADKQLMILMQKKMGDQLIEFMADKLLNFAKAFYNEQLKAYESGLIGIFEKKKAA